MTTPPASPSPGVRSTRKRLGLTQGQLAMVLGVHQVTVSKWEHGLLEPNAWQLQFLTLLERLDTMWGPALGEAADRGDLTEAIRVIVRIGSGPGTST